MREELIVSGRLNPKIDPVLHIWSWEIPLYLFVGGLAAGLLIYAAFYFLRNQDSPKMDTVIKWAPLLAPPLIAIGLLALFLDLKHKPYFWQLYTTIRFESPMSWGAWTLMAVMPLSIIWVALHLKTLFPVINFSNRFLKPLTLIFKPIKDNTDYNWEWRYEWLGKLEQFFQKNIKIVAWMMLFFAIILGIYTGILLSAFNARPLWNTSILGPLFLVSGLSTAAALILLLTKDEFEKKLFTKIDMVMIGIELFLIIHLFMGMLASTEVQIEAAKMFLGGPYTLIFWIGVVILGLIIPFLLEALEMRGYHVPVIFSAGLVLIGGIILRFVIVSAGQASRYLY